MPLLAKEKQAQMLLQQHPFCCEEASKELSSGKDNHRQVDAKLGGKETTAAPSLPHEGYRKEASRELKQFLKHSDPSVEGMSHRRIQPVKSCLSHPLRREREHWCPSWPLARRDTTPPAPPPGAFSPLLSPGSCSGCQKRPGLNFPARRERCSWGRVRGWQTHTPPFSLLSTLPLKSREPPNAAAPLPRAVPCRRCCGAGAGRGWG